MRTWSRPRLGLPPVWSGPAEGKWEKSQSIKGKRVGPWILETRVENLGQSRWAALSWFHNRLQDNERLFLADTVPSLASPFFWGGKSKWWPLINSIKDSPTPQSSPLGLMAFKPVQNGFLYSRFLTLPPSVSHIQDLTSRIVDGSLWLPHSSDTGWPKYPLSCVCTFPTFREQPPPQNITRGREGPDCSHFLSQQGRASALSTSRNGFMSKLNQPSWSPVRWDWVFTGPSAGGSSGYWERIWSLETQGLELQACYPISRGLVYLSVEGASNSTYLVGLAWRVSNMGQGLWIKQGTPSATK